MYISNSLLDVRNQTIKNIYIVYILSNISIDLVNIWC